MAQWVKNLTAATSVTARGVGSAPGLAQQVKGSGVATAASWVTAVARIQFLAWELPYAVGAAIKKKKKLSKNPKKTQKQKAFPLWHRENESDQEP